MRRIALTVFVMGWAIFASPALAGSDGPFGGGGMPGSPLVKAMDANGSGVIEASEIANAGAVLKSLDQNGDGRLTAAELMPPRAGGAPSGESPFGKARRPVDAKPPVCPVLKALDKDADGKLDKTEIAKAGEALKTLDANRNGVLEGGELRPARPPMGAGNRGPFGRQ